MASNVYLDCCFERKMKEKTFECLTCKKKFVSKKTLNGHKKLHNKSISYQCKICQKIFQTKYNLNRHNRTHTGEKPYVCSTCDKRFARKYELTNHQATHINERKFKCEVCIPSISFTTNQQLTDHMVIHNEPKFTCMKCGKKFHIACQLNNEHLKFHFEPTYTCGKCGKKCHTSTILIQHEKQNIC